MHSLDGLQRRAALGPWLDFSALLARLHMARGIAGARGGYLHWWLRTAGGLVSAHRLDRRFEVYDYRNVFAVIHHHTHAAFTRHGCCGDVSARRVSLVDDRWMGPPFVVDWKRRPCSKVVGKYPKRYPAHGLVLAGWLGWCPFARTGNPRTPAQCLHAYS